MQTTTNATQDTGAQNIANALVSSVRKFDTERKHTVGQFLNAHPDAKRVVHAHRHEAREFNALGKRARFSASR